MRWRPEELVWQLLDELVLLLVPPSPHRWAMVVTYELSIV